MCQEEHRILGAPVAVNCGLPDEVQSARARDLTG